ncbi:MAG: hypothetical protein GY736_05195 [Sphingomonas sp.]|uniref:hypothetical protein n=1 Tax=Sphingomonas sp. TaxID=28214 RepID=UPI00258C0C09|nr:hypothetical protein [Sphingomonas sp.]MCP4025694.1 hypothetical protein [Sphingomonas sp.]
MDVPTTSDIVAAIERFLARHDDMAPTRFGREATGEPQLLESLRKGRSPSLDTANRIVSFMRAKDEEAGFVADHDAGNCAAAVASSSGMIGEISTQVAA